MDDEIRKLLRGEEGALQSGRTPTGSELGELIRERGLEDAADLVTLASDAALAQVLDQDLWRAAAPGEAEEFDERRFAQWLEILGDDDPVAAAKRIAAMDEELVAFGLSRIVRVFDRDQVALAGWAAFLNQDLDEVLSSEASVDIDRWLVLSRGYDGWTELVAVLLELFEEHGDLFERLMTTCEQTNSSAIIETERADHEALSVEDEVAGDVAAARERRRTTEGFVSADDARAFLKLAELQEIGSDPITREHLGQLVERPAATPSTAISDGGLKAALATLPEELRAARGRELAFLANVLVSAGDQGAALPPAEAAELAFEVCALSYRRGGGDVGATGLVRFFGRGWRERRRAKR